LGDLCERYVSLPHYIADVAGTVPLVVVGHVRRRLQRRGERTNEILDACRADLYRRCGMLGLVCVWYVGVFSALALRLSFAMVGRPHGLTLVRAMMWTWFCSAWMVSERVRMCLQKTGVVVDVPGPS
jgi:hypothetical protein